MVQENRRAKVQRVIAIAFVLMTVSMAAFGEQSPVWVDIAVGSDDLDVVALREAISKELDCAVVANRELSHSGEIAVKSAASGQVSVAFLPPDRITPLLRVVTLPTKSENRVQLIAWLVGNMARNEAAEWLAEHQRQKGANAQGGSSAQPASLLPPSLPAGNAANKKNTGDHQQLGLQTQPAPPPKGGDAQSAAAFRSPMLRSRSINLALWHGLLELHPDAETSRFAFHFGIGYGRVGAIHGFAFDVLHHRTNFELQGVASSFGWTRVSKTQGVAFGLGVVTADYDLSGVDYAGFVTYRDGSVAGAQFAGLAAYSTQSVRGGQAAGLFTAAGNVRGVQLAWFANVAGDVTGVQTSFVNVAKNVNGVQFGLVNVAKKVDGVQIGLVNFAHNVRTQALLWTERNYLENVGVRYVYDPLTVGVSTGYDPTNDRLRFLFGFGARFAYRRFALAPSIDVGGVIDKVKSGAVGRGHENDLRLSLEWEVVPKVLSVVAGPTVAFRSDAGAKLEAVPRWFAGLNLH